MNALDTNVLVRYVTQDDPVQAAAANRAIAAVAARGDKLLLQPIVLCELIWVLETPYGFRKTELLPVLDRILHTAQFEVADKDVCYQALDDWRRGKGDFSDYWLGRANRRAGAADTLTFDKALKDSPHFCLL
jgi:predicted nucleic-acid-binding protein